MKSVRITAIVLVLAPFQIAADADSEPARPAPEMNQLDYFVGTWHCVGTDMASALGPEYRIERVVTAVKDLDGFWLTMRWEEKLTSENPHPWNVEAVFTYDSRTRVFSYIYRDNTGAWSTGTSPGWEGDKLVIVGEYLVNGQNAPYRDTYTRRGDGTHEFVTETLRNDHWSKDAEATCRR